VPRHATLIAAVAAISGIGFFAAATLVMTFVLAAQGVLKLRRSIVARRAAQTTPSPFGQ
jgi:hypothetical protein